MNVFATELQRALDDRGWSQGRLSREMGKKPAQQTIQRWLANATLPSRINVDAVADALGEDRSKWRNFWNESSTEDGTPPSPKADQATAPQDEIAWLRDAVERILVHLGMTEEGNRSDEPAPRQRRRA